MRFRGLDLNLLVALDALLSEANVTRAAERLRLSQPAASAALRRLRDWFDDPLLTSHGKAMMLTPYALRLRPQLSELLHSLEVFASQPAQFDPAHTQRRFRIAMSDYLATLALPPLSSLISERAPGIELEILPPDDNSNDLLERGELDVLFVPQEFISVRSPSKEMFVERHVIAGWSKNPLFERGLTLSDFTAAGHVSVRLGRVARMTFAEVQLRSLGINRREEIIVPSFAMVPELLVETKRLAIMHERLARYFAKQKAICFAPLPFEFPVMKEMAQFHSTRANDAGLIWLLDEMAAILAKA
jgi:LysR family transcriptional regulator, nod-box dependent transcriptional activator